MSEPAKVYLIPSVLDESGWNVLPHYIVAAVKKCEVFFAENLKTSRRYLKTLWPQMVIDDYEWFISEASRAYETDDIKKIFRQKIKAGKVIGILSEAGCPGIADPGQQLVALAHELNAEVIPLVGPNSIILALMASGLHGQHFRFAGYLPVKEPARTKTIKELEAESQKKNCTQIFIETPYRNNQLIDVLLKTCKPSTRLCMAANLTGEKEWIKTKSIADWQKNKPDLHKRPAIFLLLA